jgi:transaldolase
MFFYKHTRQTCNWKGVSSMSKTKLHTLAEVGQSVWLDYIDRTLITSGGLTTYVFRGLSGVTSNPTIFQKAISEGNDYDVQIQRMALAGKSAEEIYEGLAIEDSRMAADILHPVFEATEGGDGFFSLEVNPHLAHDKQGTINEATRLFATVNRPNVMIKVPATPEGVEAFRELIEDGININVTLMFSLDQYDQIAEAYISALEKRAANVYSLKNIASVASIFVSRLDTKVDKMLEAYNSPRAEALRGRIAIANAKMAYQHFREAFLSERWKRLEEKGARLQRVLYGSTGTKDPDYSDVMYIENLIGPNTVNTVPPKTLEEFLDHGTVALTLESDLEEARTQLNDLAELGIQLEDVTQDLLDEGVEQFEKSYDALIKIINEKKMELIST